MTVLFHAIRDATRSLRRRPLFSLAVVLCFALGIGATTAVFSVVNAVLVRPLPYPSSDRLLSLWSRMPSEAGRKLPSSVEEFFDYRDRLQSLHGVTAIMPHAVNLTGVGKPERLRAARVTSSFFSTLGRSPILGHGWEPKNDLHGYQNVVVLSHGLWRRLFGGRADVIGRKLTFDGEPYTVIGVAPPGLDIEVSGSRPELWVPLDVDLSDIPPRGFRFLRVLARLAPGVTLQAAQQELNTLASSFLQQHPEAYPRDGRWRAELVPLKEEIVGKARTPLLLLFGVVGLVLLIACANAVNLLLSRASVRRREIAVHRALGAGSGPLLVRDLGESLLLALLGGGVGLVLAFSGVRLLPHLAGDALPRVGDVAVDARVLVFTLGVSLVAGLLAGIAPALRGLRSELRRDLAERRAGDGARHRLGGVLVAIEVAVALIVLVGAGLVGRSFLAVTHVDPGFRSRNVLTAGFLMPAPKYPDGTHQAAYVGRLVERLAQVPGVRNAAAASTLPLSSIRVTLAIEPKGGREQQEESAPSVEWRAVTPGYFDVLGIARRAGRTFESTDSSEAAKVAVIDERLAKRVWGGGAKALGHRFELPLVGTAQRVSLQVVGVVGHVKSYGRDAEAPDQVYTAFSQTPIHFASLALRTDGDPMSFASTVAQAVWSVDADQPLTDIRSLDDVLNESVAGRALGAGLLVSFAFLSLILAVLGVYAVTSYSVARRRHEIGVRMALGANRSTVMRQSLGRGLSPTLIGIVIGALVSLLARGAVSSLLFGIADTDWFTYAGTAVVMILAAALASLVPARRAAHVDPSTVLREE